MPPVNTEGLIQFFIDYIFAWLDSYWWAVAIVGVFWYVGWVWRLDRLGVSYPKIDALGSMLYQTQNWLSNASRITITIVGSLFGGTVWLLKGSGGLVEGLLSLDPVMAFNTAIVIVSTIVGLGNETIDPLDVLVFAALVGGVFILIRAFIGTIGREAMREDDD